MASSGERASSTAGPRHTTPRHATSRHYVMCPPAYFAVEYAINPWMDPSSPVDATKAMSQWEDLKDTYERLGHTVEVVEPQPGLPDMVFADNSGTVIDGRVLGAKFHAPQRSAEADHFRRWFLSQGYRELVMPQHVNEAEGDFVWTGRYLLAGSGYRTAPEAHAEAQEVLRVPVVSLTLVDPRYYHLNTALFVLNRGSEPHIAYYPKAFSEASLRVLERLFPDAILVGDADADCLGLNAVSDGKNVILPVEATALAAQIEDCGYEPVFVDLSEIRKAGGAHKCCTMELHT